MQLGRYRKLIAGGFGIATLLVLNHLGADHWVYVDLVGVAALLGIERLGNDASPGQGDEA